MACPDMRKNVNNPWPPASAHMGPPNPVSGPARGRGAGAPAGRASGRPLAGGRRPGGARGRAARASASRPPARGSRPRSRPPPRCRRPRAPAAAPTPGPPRGPAPRWRPPSPRPARRSRPQPCPTLSQPTLLICNARPSSEAADSEQASSGAAARRAAAARQRTRRRAHPTRLETERHGTFWTQACALRVGPPSGSSDRHCQAVKNADCARSRRKRCRAAQEAAVVGAGPSCSLGSGRAGGTAVSRRRQRGAPAAAPCWCRAPRRQRCRLQTAPTRAPTRPRHRRPRRARRAPGPPRPAARTGCAAPRPAPSAHLDR